MKENNRLFSIGVLAKLSGVHIRCLRYYEKIGILLPAHIDEETGYRYYTYRQMRIVEAIQYCVELDIPLKKFSQFLSRDGGQIDFAALIEYGKKVTEEKMHSILARQRFLEEMTEGMNHAKKCFYQKQTKAYFPEKYVYAIPYDGPQAGGAFQSAVVRLINDLESHGLKAGYDIGVLTKTGKDTKTSYCFADIKTTGSDMSAFPCVMKIPAGEYLCVTSPESSIQGADRIFKEQYAQAYDKIILETELFLEKFRYNEPVYELRCLLSQ